MRSRNEDIVGGHLSFDFVTPVPGVVSGSLRGGWPSAGMIWGGATSLGPICLSGEWGVPQVLVIGHQPGGRGR